jgi:type IV secretory pathway VirJ component
MTYQQKVQKEHGRNSGACDRHSELNGHLHCLRRLLSIRPVGRNFGKDYQRSLLKLDIAKLRLSRWADTGDDAHNQYQFPVGTPVEAQKVEEILEEIVACFADAERVSQRFKTKSNNSTKLQAYDADTDLEPSLRTIHDKMRDLALMRQRRSSVCQKTTWALYERKYFDRVINGVAQLVEGLIQLFPATQQRQSELVVEEVEVIKSQPACKEIETAAEGIDNLLISSVQQALATQGSHSFTRNTATDEADAQYGDQYTQGVEHIGFGHSYVENTASGKVKVHYGNKYLYPAQNY